MPKICPNTIICNGEVYFPYFKYCDLCIFCLEHLPSSKKTIDIEFEEKECNICWETKLCGIQPNCSHYTCIECLQKTYFDIMFFEPEPEFPLPDIEEEYNKGYLDLSEYPEIVKYREDCRNHKIRRRQRFLDTRYLRRCALCRV